MSRGVRLKPAAESEFEEAHAWYEEQSPGLGDQLARDLDSVLRRITEHPEAHAEVDGGIRRALLRRFPYGVFYVVEVSEIVVLGVMHSARDPEAWPRPD